MTDFTILVDGSSTPQYVVLVDDQQITIDTGVENQTIVIQAEGLQGPPGQSVSSFTFTPPLEFDSATDTLRIAPPIAGEVYKWNGTAWVPAMLSGVRWVEHRTITEAEAAAKAITLAHPITDYSRLSVDVAQGGGALFPEIDFEILGNSISWAGLGFDGLLESGDRVRIIYE